MGELSDRRTTFMESHRLAVRMIDIEGSTSSSMQTRLNGCVKAKRRIGQPTRLRFGRRSLMSSEQAG